MKERGTGERKKTRGEMEEVGGDTQLANRSL